MPVTRRHFLLSSAIASAAVAAPAVVGAQTNRKPYRTALFGSGWWGMNILRAAIETSDIEVVGLCDVDENLLNPAVKKIEEMTGKTPKRYKHYRELLEQQKPEIVIVGTPDHWHPLMTIDACNAGAHVYVEKPISHTVLEGLAMVKAARANDRVVQVGTHRRASPHNISAMEFLRSGKLGKIGMARAFVHYGGGPGSPTPDAPVPAGLDWDLWCGPAPLVPFNPRIHPKGFRRFLNFANGQLGDWGIHWLDQILWWSQEATGEVHPKMVASTGGRFILQDNSDAPDTQSVTYQFDNFVVEWEHRLYAANQAEKHNIGIYFYGTAGTLHLGWQDGWTFYPSSGNNIIHVEPQLNQPDGQNIAELWADFIRCIETGQRPISDIETGHQATTMCLLGMLSLKLGRGVRWDGEKQQIIDDEQATQLLRRDYRAPWVYPAT